MTKLSAQDSAESAALLEGLLFVAGDPVPLRELARILQVDEQGVIELAEHLDARCDTGLRTQRHQDTLQLVTAPRHTELIRKFLGSTKPAPLSKPALETVTVVAYHQPVTRAEIEATRGVNSDRALETLMARGLVEERGQRLVLGRPTEYGTTVGFLQYFGLSDLHDLPALPDEPEREGDPSVIGFRAPRENVHDKENGVRGNPDAV